ncbi:hypothetical protein O6H91_06G082600 [Diphasiastrum complanatum]|uniref:Uncharacterized protein n=1 Tax=Diphasiastrum complanatum TaxID=34168 RepID=A0ACC2DFL0_DIPCM|nr:hypothetical protein O6H91_06G082600 [Diphasiastrum complanatum]
MLLCCPLPSPSIVLLLLLCSLPSPPSTPCMLSTPVVRPAYSLRSLLSPPSSSFLLVAVLPSIVPPSWPTSISCLVTSQVPSRLPTPRPPCCLLLGCYCSTALICPPAYSSRLGLLLSPWLLGCLLASLLLRSLPSPPSCFLHLLRFPPLTSYPPHPSISSPVHPPSLEPPSTSPSPLLALSPSHLPDPLLADLFIETRF